MPICFATADKAAVLLKMAAKLPTLKEIIVMDQFDGVLENMAKEMNISLVLMSAVEMEGQSNPIKANPPTTNDTATICYTSGTTGNQVTYTVIIHNTGMPKGVVLSHLNIVSFSGSVIAMQNVGKMYTFTKNDVHISYLPLAHIFERVIQVHLMVYGASWGFYQGNSLLLLDDVGILKPTGSFIH